MYTYAFCQPPDPSLEMPVGIQSPVQVIESGDLAAVVESELDLEAILASDQQLQNALFAHDRVLRELFQHTTLLPLQFGTRFRSKAGLLQFLGENRQLYLKQLAEFQNQAEYLLKLIPLDPPQSPIPNGVTGRDYFLNKKQQYQVQVEQGRQRHAELEELKAAIAQTYDRWVSTEPQDGVERIYLLVPRAEEPTLRRYCQRWQQQTLLWELSLSPALPPYHFV